jgi:hypothetical protein
MIGEWKFENRNSKMVPIPPSCILTNFGFAVSGFEFRVSVFRISMAEYVIFTAYFVSNLLLFVK